MEKITKGIVFSDDIQRILNGINAFDYQYKFIPKKNVIDTLRADFKSEVNKIFNGDITIISEEDMMEINNLIWSDYPHCNTR